MDVVDWVMYVSGGAFGLLTLGLGLSRLSAFTERDINPIWWLGFIVFGGLLALSLIVDWMIPIRTTIYLANGSKIAREVHIDNRVLCLPAKSYDDFRWRIDSPSTVTVIGKDGQNNIAYKITTGTWFINTSPVFVSADMYDRRSPTIDYDALAAASSGAMHVDGRYGKPFRMFSQSSFDRVYSASGDVLQDSDSGPCPDKAPK